MGLGSFGSDGFDDEALDKASKPDDSKKKKKSQDNSKKERSQEEYVEPGKYYRKKKRYPYMSIEQVEGELQHHIHPYCTPILYGKEDEDSDWEVIDMPDRIVRVWWDQMTLKNLAHKVREHLDKDLYRLLRESPTEAMSAVDKAKRMAPKPQKPSHTRRCYICRKEHNRLSGDYQTVNKKCVCNSHTIEEIKEADLL